MKQLICTFILCSTLCIFSNRDMYNEWTVELKAMADRIISMRQQLFDALSARGFAYPFHFLLSCLWLVPTFSIGIKYQAGWFESVIPLKLSLRKRQFHFLLVSHPMSFSLLIEDILVTYYVHISIFFVLIWVYRFGNSIRSLIFCLLHWQNTFYLKARMKINHIDVPLWQYASMRYLANEICIFLEFKLSRLLFYLLAYVCASDCNLCAPCWFFFSLINSEFIHLMRSVSKFSFSFSVGTPGDWSHIIKQIGMFTFTGLNSEQVAFMTKEYHIYMTSDG